MTSGKPGGRTRTAWAAVVLFATLTLWLNQSTSGDAWGEVRDRVWKTHTASTFETVRYPFVFLYRHSFDEALYWNIAGKILGKPYDPALLATARSHSGTFEGVPAPPDGAMHRPYAEVPLEYPPLSLPFLLLPRLITSSLEGYAFVFSAIMGTCAFVAFVLVLRLFRTNTGESQAHGYLLSAALALAHGALFVQRLDAVLALLLACALHAWVRERLVLLAFFLGLAAAFKLTPLFLVLPVLAADPRFRRHGWMFVSTFAGTFALGLSPMILFSRDALPSLLRYHGERGLHCESTWATVYGLLGGSAGAATLTYGSLNLEGAVPTVLAKLALPVTCILLVVLAGYIWRRSSGAQASALRPLDRIRVLLAGCIVVWLASKVFSPQYLTWGVPLLVPLFYSKRDRLAGILMVVALVLTQVYLRGYYDAVRDMKVLGLVTLALRDAALGAACLRLLRNFGAERTVHGPVAQALTSSAERSGSG